MAPENVRSPAENRASQDDLHNTDGLIIPPRTLSLNDSIERAPALGYLVQLHTPPAPQAPQPPAPPLLHAHARCAGCATFQSGCWS
jgi:hypothetical protein